MKTLAKNVKKKNVKPKSAKEMEFIAPITRKLAKKTRSCLMCDKPFNSNGPFNRRCPACDRLVSLGRGGSNYDAAVHRTSLNDN